MLARADYLRATRVEEVTATPCWSIDPPAVDANSSTGYALGQRRLIVPGRHGPSYRWIIQAQRLLNDGFWRQHRNVDDNAPEGRHSYATLPYRVWLATLAWADHVATGHPTGVSVERAAIVADPLLHALLLASAAWMAARRFGPWSAAALAVGLASLFPLAATFQAGAPDDHALAYACTFLSLLALTAAFVPTFEIEPLRDHRRWYMSAGVFGGIGLWVDITTTGPVIAAIGFAGLVHGILRLRRAEVDSGFASGWRWWSRTGGTVVLVAWLLEFFPSRLTWTVESIHPLLGFAWIGLGEAPVALERLRTSSDARARLRNLAHLVVAVAAVVMLPIAIHLGGSGRLLADHPFVDQLANIPGGAPAASLSAWWRTGGGAMLQITLLPTLVLVLAAYHLLRSREHCLRPALAVALAVAVVALVLATTNLRAWNLVDAAVLVLAAVVFRGLESWTARAIGFAVSLAVFLPGLLLVYPEATTRPGAPLGHDELRSIIERDLAYWLRRESDHEMPVVFTTPGLTERLIFHAGVRGLVTYDRDNNAGFNGAVRLASATSAREAQALIEARTITHLIIPSWDPTLEALVRLGLRLPPGTPVPPNAFAAEIERLELPGWLRPLAYHLPAQPGFEHRRVTIAAVTAEQEEPLATCRRINLMVEMGDSIGVRRLRDTLALYPRDVSAMAARANADLFLGDSSALEETISALVPQLSRRAARSLPPDIRITTAALLARAGIADAARAQIEQCLQLLDTDQILRLSTGTRVQLLALSRLYGLHFNEPGLREFTLALLPPAIRAQVARTETPTTPR